MSKEQKIRVIFSVGLLLVVLSSFYLSKFFTRTDISETETMGNTQIFQRTQDCIAERQKIQSEIEKNNKTDWEERLVEIFYAPKLDTCLYISEVDPDEHSWRVMKRLVDHRSVVGSEPMDSCEYPERTLILTSKMLAERNNDIRLLTVIEKDEARPYESWCDSFDYRVERLKSY